MSEINAKKSPPKTGTKPAATDASAAAAAMAAIAAAQNTEQPATKTAAPSTKKPTKRKVRATTIVILIFSAAICLMLSAMFISYHMSFDLARKDYAILREIEERYRSVRESQAGPWPGVQPGAMPGALPEALPMPASSAISEAPYISPFDMEMQAINPEYVCWIRIEDTKVDYPVVRAEDNEKYLNLSFFGENSRVGTLFMDYRCAGEHVPHIIVYGHNAREGDMFGELKKYLDKQYLAEHPIILLRANDRIVEYEIFSARKTNVHDPAYFIDFSKPGSFQAFLERNSAPLDASQILTLSTCVSAGNDEERILVQGVFR